MRRPLARVVRERGDLFGILFTDVFEEFSGVVFREGEGFCVVGEGEGHSWYDVISAFIYLCAHVFS